MKLSVIIPVYNEAATVAELIRRVDAVGIPKGINVVDDFSTDGSRKVLEGLTYHPVQETPTQDAGGNLLDSL